MAGSQHRSGYIVGVILLFLFTTDAVADEQRVISASSEIESTPTNATLVIEPGTVPLSQVRRLHGAVRSFRTARGIVLTPAQFLQLHGEALGIGADDALEPPANRPATSPLGPCQVHHYRQTHRSVPLLNGYYHLIECAGTVTGGLGQLETGLDINPRAKLTPAQSIESARRAITNQLPRAEVSPVGPPELVVQVERQGRVRRARLAYRLRMSLRTPPQNMEVLVDANSGEILRQHSLLQRAWQEITASGDSDYDGQVSFAAQQSDSDNRIRLRTEAVMDIWTRDAKSQRTKSNPEEIIINDPMASIELIQHGLSAHWAAQQAWAFFASRYGWIGIDGNGTKGLRIYLNLQYPAQDSLGLDSFGSTDAGWFGDDPLDPNIPPGKWELIALGSGGINKNGNVVGPLVHPEILAHEMTHAIQYHSHFGSQQGFYFDPANPDTAGLSESFADIFGVLVEADARQAPVDYWIGNEWKEKEPRRLDNPALSKPAHPVKYQDATWNALLAVPNVGPHPFGGPHSHAFYRFAEGNPPSFAGVGVDKAGLIYFLAMTELLGPGADYLSALDAERTVAETLYGEHTVTVASLLEAAFAAGYGPGYQNTLFYAPADQETDVEPWPVELTWEPLGLEVQWQVEISPTADFSGELVSRTTAPLAPGALPQTLSLALRQRPNLRTDTEYYWRVRGRKVYSTEWQDWRVPVMFKTSAKIAQPIEPWLEHRIEYHPWELVFNWESVSNAQAYELQVLEGPHNQPSDWEDPLLAPEPTPTPGMILDVRVERDHTWRIRAIGPDGEHGENYGRWAEAPFVTELPVVHLLEPLNGDPRYPWPTWLKWDEVKGADHYLLDLTDCDGVFKSANPNSPVPCANLNPNLSYDPVKVGADQLQFPLNVQPEWLHDNVRYWWQARVVGPPPWYDEGGLPMEDGHWRVDGADTLPDQLFPELSVGNAACIDLNEPIIFEWSNVVNATGYVLRVTEAWAESGASPSSKFIIERGPEVFSTSLPVEPGTNQQKAIAHIGAGPMQGPLHLGYWWHIQALGPDGYRGLEDLFGAFYFIEPDTPTPSIEDGQVFAENDPVVLKWKSDHAPFAEYLLKAYEGMGCLDSNLLATLHTKGKSPGDSSAIASSTNWAPGATLSWSVSNNIWLNSQCFQGPKHSPCMTFKAPSPICGNGKRETGEECDDGNMINGDGCSSKCEKALACGQNHQSSGGFADPQDNEELDLGGNQGVLWITVETFQVPDKMTFKHDGQIVAWTDCVGTNGPETIKVNIDGMSSSLFVDVVPGCDPDIPSSGTKWAYAVSCVDDTATVPDDVTE